jgi:hypothetical protein
VLARQHARELGFLDALAQLRLGELQLGERGASIVRLLAREPDQLVGVVDVREPAVELAERAQRALQLALLAQDALGLLAVFPQGGVARGTLQLLEPRLLRDQVKDASAAPRSARVARAARSRARGSWYWYLRARPSPRGAPFIAKGPDRSMRMTCG